MAGKLTYASLPVEIKRIANDAMGLGFLKSIFSTSHTYHLMIKINHGVFVGFSLYHFEQQRRARETVAVGVVDCVCVATAYRREGFGTLLTFGTLRKMSSYGAARVELTLKSPGLDDRDGEPGVPLVGNEELLTQLGFRCETIVHDHYLQKSKKYGYDCNFCGNKPDTCVAVTYSIESKSSGEES